MLAAPDLTRRQIIDRLAAAARSDVFTGGTPNADWGAGKLDVAAVLPGEGAARAPAGDHERAVTLL